MKKNRIFVFLGIAAIVGIIIYFRSKSAANQKAAEDKAAEDKAIADKLAKELADEKERLRLLALSQGSGTPGGTTNDPGSGAGTTGSTKPYKEYDPNSQTGASLIKYRIEEFLNNDTAIYSIKADAKIGNRLFDGVSTVNYNKWGKDSSPKDDLTNFLFEIGGGKFTPNDYGTYPVFTSIQYPSLDGELSIMADNTWVTNDDRAFWDRPQDKYILHSLGGAQMLSHFGSFERKHVYNTYKNTIQFSKNYRAEMRRLLDVLEDAAIRSLKEQDNIYFIGINA